MAWTQGNYVAGSGAGVAKAIVTSSQIWRNVTFQVSNGTTGRYCILGGADMADTDDTAATRKGVFIAAIEDASEGLGDCKTFTIEGPIDLFTLRVIRSNNSDVLHWFGNKTS